jgi:alkylation response protein AidB-like acyl-CoA dehydrogenase
MRARDLMDRLVYPNEARLEREDDEAEALVKELRAKVRAAGLWAPHIGPEAGGSGRGFVAYAFLNELIGRSAWAPLIFGCQAPDAGNAEILHLLGTGDQRRRWLAPLVAGDVRSFFSMTEPEVSGSDPTGLRTTAVRVGDDWVIDGHKWFSSGAEGAAFGIVMAVTDPDAEPHRRMSQIIVPATTPGVEIVRAIPVLGHRGRGWSTHCEVRYRGVRVPVANTIGEVNKGFQQQMAQFQNERMIAAYLGVGACELALDRTVDYLKQRRAFGRPLLDNQHLQFELGECIAEVDMLRHYNYACADAYLRGEDTTRFATIAKWKVGKLARKVADVCLQFHGGMGYVEENWTARFYRDYRLWAIGGGADEVMMRTLVRMEGMPG